MKPPGDGKLLLKKKSNEENEADLFSSTPSTRRQHLLKATSSPGDTINMYRTWRSLEELNKDSEKSAQIQHILSTGNFDHIEHESIRIRGANTSDMTVKVDRTRLAFGRENLILEVKFSDDVLWILRVPLQITADTPTSLLSEVTTMSVVRQRTTIPVPQVYAFEVTARPFGFPYILMERLPGTTPSLGLSVAVPQMHHRKVAQQIARVLHELSRITFDRIGRLVTDEQDQITVVGNNWHSVRSPMKTSLEYFYVERYAENLNVYNKHGNDAHCNTACWILINSLTHVIIPDRINGPFPLSHLDLFFGNLLFDEEFNLTGVLDWTNAQTGPWEQLAVLPDFMVSSGSNSVAERRFRGLVIEELVQLEFHQSADTRLSDHLSSIGSEIYACQYMDAANDALNAAQRIAGMIYKNDLSWDQLVAIYGDLPAPRNSR